MRHRSALGGREPVAQPVEHLTFNQGVLGSSPSGLTNCGSIRRSALAVIHRHDLHSVFIDACRSNNLISLETDHTVEDFEQDDESVTLALHSGERIRGRALIGCDGMWSKVRDEIVGDGKRLVSGHIAYRAIFRGSARKSCACSSASRPGACGSCAIASR
jgi:2-polyprenyl-6-methoxyphenol hydroxylase-like FAD-dependent oxidoreductase